MKRIIKLFKSDLLFSKGQDFVSKGRLDEALIAFDQALLLIPNNGGILLHKALALSDKNEYDKAIATVQIAIDLNPMNSVYYMFLGRIHYDNCMFDAAIQTLDKSLSIDPNNTLTLCLRNLSVLAKQHNDNAFKQLKIEFKNTNLEFQSRLLFLCELHLVKTNEELKSTEIVPEENLTSHNKIIQLFDNLVYSIWTMNYRIRYFRNKRKLSAYIHYLEGMKISSTNLSSAIEEYKKALNVYPELEEARDQLIDFHFQRNDFSHVLEYIEPEGNLNDESNSQLGEESNKQLSIKTENQKYLSNSKILLSGIAYYYLGKYDKSTERLLDAIEKGIDDYRTFYYLGLCNLASGDIEQSKSWFRKAVEKIDIKFFQQRLDKMSEYRSSLLRESLTEGEVE
ncbi:MAG: tetratricopeptide repeat protein [Dehalococcoidales bacterium]|nr:tetratricopeptide repeat protein [Dehalococcoidales bacterium]